MDEQSDFAVPRVIAERNRSTVTRAQSALRAYKVWAARHGYDALATDLDDWLDSLDPRGGVSDAE